MTDDYNTLVVKITAALDEICHYGPRDAILAQHIAKALTGRKELTDMHRAALKDAGWNEMASLGWRRLDHGKSEYIEPFTALIVAEWWLNRGQ